MVSGRIGQGPDQAHLHHARLCRVADAVAAGADLDQGLAATPQAPLGAAPQTDLSGRRTRRAALHLAGQSRPARTADVSGNPAAVAGDARTVAGYTPRPRSEVPTSELQLLM